MRAFTFQPNPKLVAALQKKHASPGEIFFGILITQEPVKKDQCKTRVRAMSEREYMALIQSIAEKAGGNIGRPGHGLIFIGKNADKIARGSGRTVAKKMTAPGKGFTKIVIEDSLRPLGSEPKQAQAPAPPKNDDEMFGDWDDDDPQSQSDAYAQAATQAAHQYEVEARGEPSPQLYAQAAQQAARQSAQQHNGTPQEPQMSAQDRLLWAQRVAMESSNQTMGGGPNQQGPSNDPLHPANRANMAHRIGLESTYASMPNGDRIAAMMGHGQAPPGAAHQQQPSQQQPRGRARRQAPSKEEEIVNRVIDDMFG